MGWGWDGRRPVKYDTLDGGWLPLQWFAICRALRACSRASLPASLLTHRSAQCSDPRSEHPLRSSSSVGAGAGVALGMYNTEASIRGFAESCFQYALSRKW